MLFFQEWYNRAVEQTTRAAQFIRAIDAVTVNIELSRKSDRYQAWDQLAAAVVVNDSVITEAREAHASIELHGQATRGQAVIDWNGKLGKAANVKIVTKVDKALYEQITYAAYTFA
jgi:inosine-uridine nucleoside N-ribohydrolase